MQDDEVLGELREGAAKVLCGVGRLAEDGGGVRVDREGVQCTEWLDPGVVGGRQEVVIEKEVRWRLVGNTTSLLAINTWKKGTARGGVETARGATHMAAPTMARSARWCRGARCVEGRRRVLVGAC